MTKILEVKFDEVKIFQNELHHDERGFFREWTNPIINDFVGSFTVAQINLVHSVQNVIRGLHSNLKNFQQQKLVTCVSGEIWDVVVDLRIESETFGCYSGTLLSAKNALTVSVPKGFAHGYSVISKSADVIYQVSNVYTPETEIGIYPLDKDLNIDWRLSTFPILSKKDKMGLNFQSYKESNLK